MAEWVVVPSYGTHFVEKFDENGKWVETYKEYDKCFKKLMPKGFSFAEWSAGIPQRIAEQLNCEL
jgi:hypothetical protein